jgi:hypothetical protein
LTAGTGQTILVSSVSSVITIQRQDSSGNPTTTGTTTVTLATTSSTGTFYSDSGGTTKITSITLNSPASSANIYYEDTSAGTPTLTASATGYSSVSTTLTINSLTPTPSPSPGPSSTPTPTPTPTPAPPASKLVFTAGAGQSLTIGDVSPTAIVVQRQDSSGNPVSTGTSAITVSLSTTSSNGKFYSDSAGTNTITQITIAAGSSNSAGFYYKDTSLGTPTLTASYSGLTSATTQFTINNYQLVYTNGVSQSLSAGTVSQQITIQRQDQYGNSYRPSTTITIQLT